MIKNWKQYRDLEFYPDRVCACGCGGRIKVGPQHSWCGIPKYIMGHNGRKKSYDPILYEEVEAILSGKKEAPFCKCGCGGRIRVKPYHRNYGISEYIHGHNKGMLGKHHLEESKQKIRESVQGTILTEGTKRKISEGNFGKVRTEEAKQKYREAKLGDKNPMKRPEVIRKHIKACGIKPNKPEQELKEILNRLISKEYQINIDANVLVLGGKVPDFVHIDQKKIIEMNGDYWHGEKITGRTKEEEEQQRVDLFAGYGYQTLIVWEHELKNLSRLEMKLLSFNQVGI